MKINFTIWIASFLASLTDTIVNFLLKLDRLNKFSFGYFQQTNYVNSIKATQRERSEGCSEICKYGTFQMNSFLERKIPRKL